jgi:hypothetical protein
LLHLLHEPTDVFAQLLDVRDLLHAGNHLVRIAIWKRDIIDQTAAWGVGDPAHHVRGSRPPLDHCHDVSRPRIKRGALLDRPVTSL